MTEGLVIRPCRPEECATVLDVRKMAHPNSDTLDSLDRLTQLAQAHSDLFLVAENNDRIVGAVIGGWDGWEGQIHRLAVLPECKRQGIGRALVQEVERLLLVKGARRISLLVNQRHREALGFWDSLEDIGYERDARMLRYMKNV